MSVRQLVAALGVIAVLTLVLPPLAATRVNVARIGRAHDDVQRFADTVTQDPGAVPEAAAASAGSGSVVLAGPGDAPKCVEGGAWPERRATTAGFLTPDPWGNQYFVVLPARRGDAVVVLSAGPNGSVETLFETVASGSREDLSMAGDDIAGTPRPPAAPERR